MPHASQTQSLTKREFLLVAIAFGITITAAPIYTLISIHLAIQSQNRSCDSGTIRRFHYNAPHIIVKTTAGEESLTLPSDPLSIKKRIIKPQYPIKEGDPIEWCDIHYGIFSQRYVTSLKKDGTQILSEPQATKIINDETGLMSLLALNAASYLALYAAYKFRRKK